MANVGLSALLNQRGNGAMKSSTVIDHELDPWCQPSVFKLKRFYQLQASEALHDVQHRVFADTVFYLLIAMSLFGDVQAEMREGVPETVIVHRFQPLFEIVNRFKARVFSVVVVHLLTLAQRHRSMQKTANQLVDALSRGLL